ncbi:MAG: SEC-C domain-containing protein [Firmicutes bacterium]|nr:SEC-C domain-containing protein [Bacillota bacterium]
MTGSMPKASREAFMAAWRGEAKDPEVRALRAAMEDHPEFFPLWDALDQLGDQEIEVSGVNPLLHVTFHAIVRQQEGREDIPEVSRLLQIAQHRGYSRHHAEHLAALALSHGVWELLYQYEGEEVTRYRQRLRLLGLVVEDPELPQRLLRGALRNQPCPCGSGKKLKRCCLSFVESVAEPEVGLSPVMWLESPSPYVMPEFARMVDQSDPWLIVHNLSAVAAALEEWGATAAALQAHRQMREILQSQEPDRPEDLDFASMVEEDVITLALNHPELAGAGLAALDWLAAHGFEGDSAVRVSHQLDRAEFLTYLGREAEAQALYDQLLEKIRQGAFDRELRELIFDRYEDWQHHILPQRGIAAPAGSAASP